MARDDITLQIGINAKSALAGIKGFGRAASGALKGVASSIFSLQGALTGLVAGVGIAKFISSVTDAASRQEDAVNSLNTALRLSGDFTQEASKDLQEYAAELERTTKFGDELVIEQLALAKSFGATNEQAKDLTTAAVELAAVTGKTLEEANRQVVKTLGGFAGELGEVIPSIKELTAEELKAGKAAELLIEQFGGSAAAQVNTFSGAIAQTTNTFGSLQEELGATITQNPAVIGAIKILGDTFTRLIDVVRNNQGEISAFVGTIVKAFASSLPKVVDAIGFVAKAFQGLAQIFDTVKIAAVLAIEALLEFDVVSTIVANLGNVLAALETAALDSFDAILEGVEGILGFASKFTDEFDGALQAVKDSRQGIADEVEQIAEEAAENLIDVDTVKEGLNEIKQEALNSAEETNEFFGKIQEGIGVLKDTAVDASEAIQGLSTDLVAPAAAPVVEQQKTGEGAAEGFLKEVGKNFPKIVASATSSVFAGRNGVAKLFTEGASAAIDVFAPGFGAAAKPVLDALTKGPEFVESTIQGFVDGIPDILDNIAQALPVLIETLVENVDEIVIALAKAAPAIARALFIEVPLVLAEPSLWGDVASALVQAIAEEITGIRFEFSNEKLRTILNDFGSALTRRFNDFLGRLRRPFQPIINALNRLANAIPSLGGSGGFGTGGSDLERAIGLQTGGTVPGGFPSDSFPAALTSGELVVPRNDVTDLRSFLAEQRRGSGALANMDETNALLSQLVGQGGQGGGTITLNEDGLTDLLLDFSRRNERTVA